MAYKALLHLQTRTDALFLDIDGTLLDIAPTSKDVLVPNDLILDLERLRQKLDGALAFVSGRPIAEIDKLFFPLKLACAGSHGNEWRLGSDGHIEQGPPLPEQLRNEIAETFEDMVGVIIEDKASAVAVHYRQAHDKREIIEKQLRHLLIPYSNSILLIHGRKVFEAMSADQNKGKAIERFMSALPFYGRRPVFLGDDTTDISAMDISVKLGGIAASVGKKAIRDHGFASPEEVRAWIKKSVDG